MRLLILDEVVELHRQVIESSGGSHGIRDHGALELALAQPRISFGGQDLYPGLTRKAAALGASLVQNHPFIDGNKRIGHAALEVTLVLNGLELQASVDEQEEVVLSLASGTIDRDYFIGWVLARATER